MGAPLFTEHFFEAEDSTRLYARDYAPTRPLAGLPIVCLHGLTRNSRDFELLAPWLAEQGRRVIVPDIRGRGQSGYSQDATLYNPRIYARDLRAQLADMGVNRAVFIGTSMGGVITMMLALQRSRLVAAAVLNDVGPEIAPEGLARIKGYVGVQPEFESWEDALAYVRRISAGALVDLNEEDVAMMAKRIFRMSGSKPLLDYDPRIAVPLGSGKAAPNWLAWLLYRWLARRPLLLIRGELSDILSRDCADRMVRRGKNVTFTEVPRVGHAPLLDEAEAREAIRAWLQTVS